VTDLAVDGGTPIRETLLPYARQSVDEDDVAAVVEALSSDWLTTGPAVDELERRFAAFVGAQHAVAVSSGTAGLHAVAHVLGIGPGDEVIVPPLTFAATANCVVYEGGTPVFADVEPGTLLLDPAAVEEKAGPRTKAVIAVDYTGQPCDYDALAAIADRQGFAVAADACHALGATYRSRTVGTLARLSVFSLHPVKHMTTGEGGIVTTDDEELAERMRVFRNHGITSDFRARELKGSWFYEIRDLGFNYRLTDLQCALGLSQLDKVGGWVARRREIAARYDAAFSGLAQLAPLEVVDDVEHAYHLYVVRLAVEQLRGGRAEVFAALRAEGIGVNVHHIPVHLHPFYRERFGTGPGLCPVAEAAYERILTLPLFPRMSDDDVEDVIAAVRKVTGRLALA
jgi:perosamine synthetase